MNTRVVVIGALAVAAFVWGFLSSEPAAPPPVPAAVPAPAPAPGPGNADPFAAVLPRPAALPSETPPPLVPEALFDADAPVPRELIQGALRGAIEEYFPRRKLSSDQLERLTDAVTSLRDSRAELRGLPFTSEAAERRRELVEAIGAATSDFEYILEMSPAEFTAAVQPGVGLSNDAPDEPPSKPEFLRDHPPASKE